MTLAGVDAVGDQIQTLLTAGASAILAMADILAIGAYKADQCPLPDTAAGVSLLGIDNLHIPNYLPLRLTTVGQDVYGRGYCAVRLLQGQGPQLALRQPDSRRQHRACANPITPITVCGEGRTQPPPVW